MKAGDIIKFVVYDTDNHQQSKEMVGRVVCAFAHGVIRIELGDNLGTYQIWEHNATLLSDGEALLWKLENL